MLTILLTLAVGLAAGYNIRARRKAPPGAIYPPDSAELRQAWEAGVSSHAAYMRGEMTPRGVADIRAVLGLRRMEHDQADAELAAQHLAA